MAEDEEPEFRAAVIAMFSNADLDRFMAEVGRDPLAEGELRKVKEGVFVSLSQSQPEDLEYAFCLSARGRLHFFFRKAAPRGEHIPKPT